MDSTIDYNELYDLTYQKHLDLGINEVNAELMRARDEKVVLARAIRRWTFMNDRVEKVPVQNAPVLNDIRDAYLAGDDLNETAKSMEKYLSKDPPSSVLGRDRKPVEGYSHLLAIPLDLLTMETIFWAQARRMAVRDMLKTAENWTSKEKPKAKAYSTRAEQVIALYYMLIGLGVDMKDLKKADMARMAHLLTGVPLDEMVQSDLYKLCLQDLPNIKGLSTPKRHLKFILNHFKDLDLNGIVRRIESDMANTK